jgi:hypothetical protein
VSIELDPEKRAYPDREEILSFGLDLPPRRYEIPADVLPWGDDQVYTYEQAQKLKSLGLAR